jgi:hypothetical protein
MRDSSPCSRQGLPLCIVTDTNCGLLPHSFHLFPSLRRGSFVSVALSLGLPPVAVSNCLSLRCPDFPLQQMLGRLTTSLTSKDYTRLFTTNFVKNTIYFTVSNLIKLAGHVCKMYLIKANAQLLNCLMNWP